MTLKKLLMAGAFALMIGNGAIAGPYQMSVSVDENGEFELISTYCHRHPQRCHHHHRHKQPYGHHHKWHPKDNWYHKDYRYWAKECRHHPYKKGCERFCFLNRDVCYH